MKPGTCPHCGGDVPPRANACPGCGADERTGWSEQAAGDLLGLPSDPGEFDHEAWERSEFGGGDGGAGGTRQHPRRRFWWWIALAALALFAAGWFRW